MDRFRQELNKPNFESVCNDLSFNKSNFNNENLNKINISDKEQEKICRSHNKKMDLFCIEDNERICTNCALFGDHKNHEIEEEEEILKKINAKAENILTILEKLEIYDEKQISSLAELGKLFEECIFKRDNIMNLIQEKFKVT